MCSYKTKLAKPNRFENQTYAYLTAPKKHGPERITHHITHKPRHGSPSQDTTTQNAPPTCIACAIFTPNNKNHTTTHSTLACETPGHANKKGALGRTQLALSFFQLEAKKHETTRGMSPWKWKSGHNTVCRATVKAARISQGYPRVRLGYRPMLLLLPYATMQQRGLHQTCSGLADPRAPRIISLRAHG